MDALPAKGPQLGPMRSARFARSLAGRSAPRRYGASILEPKGVIHMDLNQIFFCDFWDGFLDVWIMQWMDRNISYCQEYLSIQNFFLQHSVWNDRTNMLDILDSCGNLFLPVIFI